MAKPLISVICESTAGGVARQLELLVSEIPSRGFDLHMILSCERDPDYRRVVEEFRGKGILVDVIPMVRRPSPIADWRAYSNVRASLSARKPAVVHTHSSKAGILGRRAAASLGIPSLHTPHVFAFEWETGLKHRIYRIIERRAAGWCDGVITLSEQQRDRTLAAKICGPEKLHVIPNGVSCETFHPPSAMERQAARDHFDLPMNTPVIGVAARLEPQKGMGNFLRAVAKIKSRHPEVIIMIAGTGSMAEECRRRTVELGIDDMVRFCGNVTEMVPFYHALDCFMLASLWEGLPYVILEAMACQLPVVSTRSFGCDGLIADNETGVIANLDDVDGLATAACMILDDKRHAQTLGVNARAVVEYNFSLEQWADKLAELYRHVGHLPVTANPRGGKLEH